MAPNSGGAIVVAAMALLGLAGLPGRAVAGDGETCRDQAAAAERAAGIPEGLLLAIGKRESGRFDPQAGGVLPWPWTVNREGEDHIFDSQAEAVAYVAAAQREGSQSIDVGCFQINLKYHPAAFATLEEGFDPAANAAYAARFLTELHNRAGNWETAVAYYHSATPWHGEPYRDAVFATWHGTAEPPLAGPSAAHLPVVNPSATQPSAGAVRVVLGIRIWEPETAQPAPVAAKPVTAAAVTATPVSRTAVTGASVIMGPVRGLPRVITPSLRVAQLATKTSPFPGTAISPR